MATARLAGNEIAELLRGWPGELCDLALELRNFVLEVAPELDEGIAFHALCYYKPDRPYGKIGGHVCGISPRGDILQLGFLHGAALPDPAGLLQGTGKAKRHIELRTARDIRRREFKKLIRASVAHTPEA